MTMSDFDTLRTRIAAALYRHAQQTVPTGIPWLRWEDSFPVVQDLWLNMADAVIRELGLKRASRPKDYGHVNYPPGHQYITDWIADESVR